MGSMKIKKRHRRKTRVLHHDAAAAAIYFKVGYLKVRVDRSILSGDETGGHSCGGSTCERPAMSSQCMIDGP